MKENGFFITTPIYYVNDKPHIGHAYATLVADVVARAHRASGEAVYFLTGTDEHGAKVARSAESAGKHPQEFCDEIAGLFQDAWKSIGISHNRFIRTTESDHIETVQSCLKKLKENGALYEGEYEGLYCTGCESFIQEKDLIEGKCPHHNKEPELLKEKNWFFRLTAYIPRVEQAILENRIVVAPDHFRNEVLALLKQDLEDFSVTRAGVSWGIPLPWDESQTIYVWVDALINYLSATGWGNTHAHPDAPSWPADVHVVGKDILKFCVFCGCGVLMALGLEPPRGVTIHGFFTVDGQKMSKTLGNVISPHDLVNEYGADSSRYLLLTQFPFGQDGDIAFAKFKEKYNADLANGIGNLVQRVSTLVENFGLQREVVPIVDEGFVTSIREQMKGFSIFEAVDEVMKKVRESDGALAMSQPWKKDATIESDRNEVQQILQDASNSIVTIASAFEPIMPIISSEILKRFVGGNITIGVALFPRK